MLTSTANRGKRSRSSSSSSSSSSSAASSTNGSIFSRLTCTDSASSLSNYSSPAGSSTASPPIKGEEIDRPCKLLKSNKGSSTDAVLDHVEKVSLLESVAKQQTFEAEPQFLALGSKNVFVDCLVDAAVHMLDIIWYAPLLRAFDFVCEESPTASSSIFDDIVRSPACAVGRKVAQQTIPFELFVRETLRRSKTSCSTLQAALLFCKRAGGEVIRNRAIEEGVILTTEQLERLPGCALSYPSLSLSQHSTDHHILCNRRIFLASVMISSKFLQDRTYSNRAWSKITGLSVQELSHVERLLLKALDFNLNVGEDDWTTWTNFLKTQWKAVRPISRSGMLQSKSISAVQVSSNRNVLARTRSLPEGSVSNDEEEEEGEEEGEEAVDADVSLPSGDQHAFFATSDVTLVLTASPLTIDQSATTADHATPTSNSLDADTSTPTNSVKYTTSGDNILTSTTISRVGEDTSPKTGQSLLSTALINHHLQAYS